MGGYYRMKKKYTSFDCTNTYTHNKNPIVPNNCISSGPLNRFQNTNLKKKTNRKIQFNKQFIERVKNETFYSRSRTQQQKKQQQQQHQSMAIEI